MKTRNGFFFFFFQKINKKKRSPFQEDNNYFVLKSLITFYNHILRIIQLVVHENLNQDVDLF